MEKKDYISRDLYRKTRNNADFKAQEVAFNIIDSDNNAGKKLSSAQQRRLSDVYNAKLDLMARMERSTKKLSMLNDELENIIEKRKNAAISLQECLEKIKNLSEPDGGRELHEYLREVEHMRMEYFRLETEIEPLLKEFSAAGEQNNSANSLNASAGALFKIGFYGAVPLIITILTGALIVGAAVIYAMKV